MASSSDSQNPQWWATPPQPASDAPPSSAWWEMKPTSTETKPKEPAEGASTRFAKSLLHGLSPITIASGAYNAIRHPYDTFVAPTIEHGSRAIQAVKDRKLQLAGEQFGAAVPIIGPIVDALREQERSGDTAGMLGTAVAAVAGPKVIKSSGSIAKLAANQIARVPLRRTSAATRTAALEHGAMPGIIRTGASRTKDLLNEAANNVRDILDGPEGRRRTLKVSSQKQIQEAGRRPDWEPHRAAAQGVEDRMMSNPALQPHPTAGGYFEVAEGGLSKTRHLATDAALQEQAIANMMLDESARVARGARPSIARFRELDDVAKAYHAIKQSGDTPIPAPTIRTRILAAIANRATGPSAQGIYNTGKAATVVADKFPNAIRAAMLAELLKHSDGRENR